MSNQTTNRSGHRWVVLATYVATIFVNQIYVVCFAPLLTSIQHRYGVGEGTASLLLLVFPAVYLLTSIPSGLLADRRGFRTAIGAGALLQIVFSAIRIYDASFGALLIGQLGLAVAQPLVLNGISKLVSEWFEPKQAALATGLGTVGMFAGMAFGLATTPLWEKSIGLQSTMIVQTALAAAAGLAFFFGGKERADRASASESAPAAGTSTRELLAHGDLRLLFLLAFLGLGVFNGFVTWLEPIVAPHGIDAAAAGLMGGVLILGGIAGAVIVPALSDRAGRRRPFMRACFFASTLLFVAFTLSGTMAALTCVAALLGFSFLGAFPLLLETTAHHAGPARTGTATSILMLAGNAGGVIVMVAMPAIKGSSPTYTPAMVLLIAIMVVICLLSALLAETRTRRALARSTETVLHTLMARARTDGPRPALWRKQNGVYTPTSWGDYADRVERFALGLERLGFASGECLAILGPNNPEWLVANLGAMALGGVGVGIYTSSSDEQLRYVVEHCGAKRIFAGDPASLERARALVDALPVPLQIIVAPGASNGAAATGKADEDAAVTFERVLEMGGQVERARYRAHIDMLAPDQLATLIYTSGTTGAPKGIMLDHRALCASAHSLHETLSLSDDEIFVSYLPLSHIAEQLSSVYGPILFGAQVYFTESLEKLAENIAEARPTCFFGVPRVWERVQSALESKFPTLPPRAQSMLKWARTTAFAHNTKLLKGEPRSLGLQVSYAVAQRILRSLKQRLGFGRARLLTSSAAPIGRDTLEFFASIDIVLRELYGQSEVAGATTANTVADTRFGTVGRPLAGLEMRVAEDGEILVRSDTCCMGYYRNPEATAALIVDGWVHSGDLGAIDPDGYLRVVGRKKEIIALSNGEKTAPGAIEERIKRIAPVEHALVLGEGRPHLVALITLEPEGARSLAREHGWPADVSELASHPAFVAHLTAQIRREVNPRVAAHETIEAVSVLPASFGVRTGELTPTLKVKRDVVLRKWQARIESMYGEPALHAPRSSHVRDTAARALSAEG